EPHRLSPERCPSGLMSEQLAQAAGWPHRGLHTRMQGPVRPVSTSCSILLGARVYTSLHHPLMRNRSIPNAGRRAKSSVTRKSTTRVGLLAPTLAIVAILLAAAGVGGWLWWRYLPRAVTSFNGELLGHLPVGVQPARLNLLLITLDTTRADRLHAYGFDAIET